MGAFGMMLGDILYALSFDSVKIHILSDAALGKVRLPDLVWFAGLAVLAVGLFALVEWQSRFMS